MPVSAALLDGALLAHRLRILIKNLWLRRASAVVIA